MSQPSFAANALQFKASSGQDVQVKLEGEFEQLFSECEKLKLTIRETESKLPTMASPAYRSNAQNRLRILKSQFKTKTQRQRTLGSQLRMKLIRNSLATWSVKKDEWSAERLFEGLCSESLTPIKSALNEPPYGGTAWKTCLQELDLGLQSLYKVWQSSAQSPQLKAALQPIKSLAFPDKANPQEKSLIKRYLLLIENALLRVLGQASRNPPTLKTVHANLKPELVKPQKTKIKGLGDLQVSFDLRTRKTVVKDQLGVQVNENRRPFDELLGDGIEALDVAFKKPPPQIPLVQAAITYLSEAMSADPKRFEPYFSLGYLFANLEDWERALKLLDTAYAISHREDILGFRQEVKQSAKSENRWQAG